MSSFFFSDPAPVLEASHTLEERLQQLQSSAPDSEALVREISRHWRKHLECLEKTGQAKIRHIRKRYFLTASLCFELLPHLCLVVLRGKFN